MPTHVAYIPPGRDAPKKARGERMRAVQSVMAEHAAEVARLEQSTQQALLPVLLEARRDLKAGLATWLSTVKDGKERFTAQQLRNALLAVETTLRTMAEREPDVLAALTRAGVRAGELGTRHLVQEVARFSEVFEGTPHRVQIDTAAVIARGDRLLIPRYRTSAARYVGAVRDDIRQQFAVGLASGETFEQLTRRLVRLGGPRGLVALRGVVGEPGAHVEEIAEGLFRRYRHWAERLTRTEVVHAYNVQHQQALTELDATRTEGEPAYCRRWDASTDRRVCPICANLDRRAVGIEELFPGGIAQPPAHPMCRCTVSAWHPSWGSIKGEVPPIQDEEPPANPRPRPAAPPPVALQPSLDYEPSDLAGVPGGLFGCSLPSDGDAIDGGSIQIRRTAAGHEAMFKVTAHHSQQLAAAFADAELDDFNMQPQQLVDGRLAPTGGAPQRVGLGRAISLPGYRAEMGTTGAIQNYVRLTVPSGNPERLHAALADFAERSGVPVLRKRTADDVRLQAMAQLSAKFDPAGYVREVGPDASPAKIRAFFERTAQQHEIMREALEDTEERELYPGYRGLFSRKLAEYMTRNNGVLTHDGAPSVAVVESILTDTGLMSSLTRYQAGVFTQGLSTLQDFESGGADGVFLRVRRAGSGDGSKASRFRLVVDPAQLGRLDWWAFNQDNYGATGWSDFDQRWPAADMASDSQVMLGNEVMPRRGVPKEAILRVICSRKDKRDLVASLQKRGITEINGVPLDQFFVAR